MGWLEDHNNLNRRLEHHLAYTTVPRVASKLGPGWRAEGLRLEGPQGEDLEFQLSGLFGTPKLLIYLDRGLEKPADLPTSISVAPTARPETIVRELHAELLPFRVKVLPEQASGPGPDKGRCASPGGAELPSRPVEASPRPQTPAIS